MKLSAVEREVKAIYLSTSGIPYSYSYHLKKLLPSHHYMHIYLFIFFIVVVSFFFLPFSFVNLSFFFSTVVCVWKILNLNKKNKVQIIKIIIIILIIIIIT